MFLILQKYKFLIQYFGSHSSERNSLKFPFMTFCYLVVVIANILAPLNNKNVKELPNSFIATAGTSTISIYILHILFNRVRFDSLENDLQNIVNERECESVHQLVCVPIKIYSIPFYRDSVEGKRYVVCKSGTTNHALC